MIDFSGLAKASSAPKVVPTPKETKPSISELSIERILYLYSLCDNDEQAKEFVLRLTDEQRAALQQKSEAIEDEVAAEYFDTDSSEDEPEDLEDSDEDTDEDTDEDSDAESFFEDDSDEELDDEEDSEDTEPEATPENKLNQGVLPSTSSENDKSEPDLANAALVARLFGQPPVKPVQPSVIESDEYDEDSDEDDEYSDEEDEDSDEYDEDSEEYDEDSDEEDEDSDEEDEDSDEYSDEEDEELDEDYVDDTEPEAKSTESKPKQGVLPPASDEYIDLFDDDEYESDDDEDEPDDEPEAPSTVNTAVIARLFGQPSAKPVQTPVVESDDEYDDSDEEEEQEYSEEEDSDEYDEDSDEYDEDSEEYDEDSDEEEEQEYSEDEDSDGEYPEVEVSAEVSDENIESPSEGIPAPDDYSESPSEGIPAPDENIEATPPTPVIQKSELGGAAKDIFSQVMSMPSPDEELAHNPYVREVDKSVTARNTQANQVEKAVGTITQGYDIMKDTEPEVKSLCGEVYREGWSLTKYLQANRGNKQACSKEVVLHYYSPETIQRGEDMGKFVISRGILRF